LKRGLTARTIPLEIWSSYRAKAQRLFPDKSPDDSRSRKWQELSRPIDAAARGNFAVKLHAGILGALKLATKLFGCLLRVILKLLDLVRDAHFSSSVDVAAI
jgi:hypothetical protein